MSQENVEVVRLALNGFNREGLGAVDHLGEVFDPDVEMRALGRLPDSTEVVRGYDGLKAFFTGLLGMLDMRLEADELIHAGDSVVVVLRMIARGRGSGAELTNHMVFVYGFREERICRVDAYGTKAEALEAVGPRE